MRFAVPYNLLSSRNVEFAQKKVYQIKSDMLYLTIIVFHL